MLGGDLGCLLNIAGRIKRRGLPMRVLHTAEVLAGMGEQPSIGEPGQSLMHAATTTFPQRVSIAILDKRLQAALDHASGGFVHKRAALVAALPEFEALRERARDVKNHVLANLDIYLERYEEQVDAPRRPGALGGHGRRGARDHPRHLPQGRRQDHHQGQVDGQRGDRR